MYILYQSNGPHESVLSLIAKLDGGRVKEVFRVVDKADRKQVKYVVIMSDRSFLCTCLLLQNTGVVCSHFFCTMQRSNLCQYHVGLVLRRWFKDDFHNRPGNEKEVSSLPFLVARPHRHSRVDTRPESSFMSDVRELFQSEEFRPSHSREERAKKKTYAEASGLFKSIMAVAQENPEAQEAMVNFLEMLHRSLRSNGGSSQSEDQLRDEQGSLKDPKVAKPIGRPRSRRHRASDEASSSRNKKRRLN